MDSLHWTNIEIIELRKSSDGTELIVKDNCPCKEGDSISYGKLLYYINSKKKAGGKRCILLVDKLEEEL